MSFEFLDHTGDVGFVAEAPTLDGLLAEAVAAFVATVTEPERIESRETRAFTVTAEAPDLLVHGVLEEVLFRFEVGGFLPRTARATVTERGREWLAELNLAELVRPEGLAWNRLPHPADFRPNGWRRLDQFFSGQAEEHWVAVTGADRLVGALILLSGLADGDRLTLLTHPAVRGQVERPLLSRGLRRLSPRTAQIRLEHPAGDPAAEAALREFGFTAARTLRWLKLGVR